MSQARIVPRVRKRSRPVEASVPRREGVMFEDVRLYLVERKMGSSRRSFLTQLARSKGFIVDNILSDVVTHVVSEDCQASSLWTWLKECALKNLPNMHVLDISWFTDSMREGRPVAVETRHLIQDTLPTEGSTPTPVATVSQYACQRRTTTENKNQIFTVRNCYLTSLWTQLNFCMGKHADVGTVFLNKTHYFYVLQEILQHGRSSEVEKILSDERYQTLKLFTSVFGVGPKTAEKWYRRGLRSFSDILAEPSIHLNRMQQSGFLHYGDISRAVTKVEARALGNIIDEAVHAITPDAMLTLTGGFRRYKTYLNISDQFLHLFLLQYFIFSLYQGILLYSEYQASTFDMHKLPTYRFEAMDHFAKCFLILRLERSQVEGGLNSGEGDSRDWRAVRVDLVSPPMDRYAFALLGWTGSRFERDLRRFARMERRMLLDNHALYDKAKKEFLAAMTEKDIFTHLGLEYIEPWQRNA
uniref:BRCT domain-containing protein n=1 Tax=Monopterus albus TaxID=43700 RepID=A0A3Q3JB73_MONAL